MQFNFANMSVLERCVLFISLVCVLLQVQCTTVARQPMPARQRMNMLQMPNEDSWKGSKLANDSNFVIANFDGNIESINMLINKKEKNDSDSENRTEELTSGDKKFSFFYFNFDEDSNDYRVNIRKLSHSNERHMERKRNWQNFYHSRQLPPHHHHNFHNSHDKFSNNHHGFFGDNNHQHMSGGWPHFPGNQPFGSSPPFFQNNHNSHNNHQWHQKSHFPFNHHPHPTQPSYQYHSVAPTPHLPVDTTPYSYTPKHHHYHNDVISGSHRDTEQVYPTPTYTTYTYTTTHYHSRNDKMKAFK